MNDKTSSIISVFKTQKQKDKKLEAVKDQIRICGVLGFGWQDLHIAWSINGIHQSTERLLTCFTDTIIPQQSRQGILETPKITLPSRGDSTLKLGTIITKNIAILDKNKRMKQVLLY